MKLILILISILTLSACAKSNESPATVPADPVFGNWYILGPGATSTQATGVVGQLNPDGTAQFMSVKAKSTDGIITTYYVRKMIGTYVRSGQEFKMKYSYETCNPIGEETLHIYATTNDMLHVKIFTQPMDLLMARATETSNTSMAIMIEDKNCNLF